ncbi:hypothetical protein [Shewanella sp. MBTL60-007]|uniref:hypothetical protein n=1 Tax=Shewanella sp. MBTL60-007 TaxID=2815911 RepID=UPI001BBC6882|nr:hypothetical protein [Shewanella sp. MBTL60-007]GIU20798.1 hypothetical protein TUM3792_20810 [Shewanella sp. MBTL60-007]
MLNSVIELTEELAIPTPDSLVQQELLLQQVVSQLMVDDAIALGSFDYAYSRALFEANLMVPEQITVKVETDANGNAYATQLSTELALDGDLEWWRFALTKSKN